MKKPNFLIIYPDTLGARAVGCYGNDIVQTPNIDKLAATGVKFNNCTSQNPLCCPSRMSLHTGKYVSAHGMLDNGTGYYPMEQLTFAKLLGDNDYHRAYFGKTHSVNHDEWEEIFDLYPDYNKYLQKNNISVKYPESPPLENLCHGFSDIPSKHWATNVLGDLGVDYINKRREEENPFLLMMSFEAPHGPVTYPRDEPILYNPEEIELPKAPVNALDSKTYERKLYMEARGKLGTDDNLKSALCMYYSMLTLMDRNIGKLLTALEESGQRDNTVIIFLSDHGDFMGNYNCVGKGMSLDQSLIHVPLILNCPKHFKANEVESLVESIDIFPTLTELAGLDVPAGLQGQSLVPPALNKAESEREYSFSEEFFGQGPFLFSVRNKEYKYILSSSNNEELYHLPEDTWEWNNLKDSPEHQQVLNELRHAMMLWRFRAVDQIHLRKVNFIEYLLNGEHEKLPPYLGGTAKKSKVINNEK